MSGREPEWGETSRIVAGNVQRLRDGSRLTYTELSQRLRERADWELSPVAIRRIEAMERRVSVDDLTALARALGVRPAELLDEPPPVHHFATHDEVRQMIQDALQRP